MPLLAMAVAVPSFTLHVLGSDPLAVRSGEAEAVSVLEVLAIHPLASLTVNE